jgi:hypothetical protein
MTIMSNPAYYAISYDNIHVVDPSRNYSKQCHRDYAICFPAMA